MTTLLSGPAGSKIFWRHIKMSRSALSAAAPAMASPAKNWSGPIRLDSFAPTAHSPEISPLIRIKPSTSITSWDATCPIAKK